MTTILCYFLLFAGLSTSLARSGISSMPAKATPGTNNSRLGPEAGPQAICFPPPDKHHVSTVVGTCDLLFAHFIRSFDVDPNESFLWTGDNTRRHEPGTIHLPKIEAIRNTNRTQACLMEITDNTRLGDSYSVNSIVEAGREILEQCFKQDLCGEIALLPSGTTSLAVCGSVHLNRTAPGLSMCGSECADGRRSPIIQ